MQKDLTINPECFTYKCTNAQQCFTSSSNKTIKNNEQQHYQKEIWENNTTAFLTGSDDMKKWHGKLTGVKNKFN